MGDPFGNGPEITVRALADKSIYDRCKPLVVGDETSMCYAIKDCREGSWHSFGTEYSKESIRR